MAAILVLLVLGPVAFDAVTLWPELSIAMPSVNDDVHHYLFIQRASRALEMGQSLVDHWAPEVELGFPHLLYYADLAWHFDERNPAHYDLFDVRYMVAPRRLPMPAFLRPIKETSRYVLYEAPTTGNARFVTLARRNSVRAQSTLFFQNRQWFLGRDLPAGRFVRYDFPAGSDGSVSLRKDGSSPAGCPGGGKIQETRILPGRFDLRVGLPGRLDARAEGDIPPELAGDRGRPAAAALHGVAQLHRPRPARRRSRGPGGISFAGLQDRPARRWRLRPRGHARVQTPRRPAGGDPRLRKRPWHAQDERPGASPRTSRTSGTIVPATISGSRSSTPTSPRGVPSTRRSAASPAYSTSATVGSSTTGWGFPRASWRSIPPGASTRILREQDEKRKQSDGKMISNLHFVKEIGRKSRETLEAGNLEGFAELMNVHWEHKKRRSARMSNDCIEQSYALARANGALGGKVVGAGSGGFLMFYALDKVRLRAAGLQEVRFRFDFEGTKVVAQS